MTSSEEGSMKFQSIALIHLHSSLMFLGCHSFSICKFNFSYR